MTSIFLDDDLVADAVRLTGAATEQEAVTIALREQLHLVRQAAAARELFGSLQWQGDLEQSVWVTSMVLNDGCGYHSLD